MKFGCTDPEGKIWSYEYDGEHQNLIKIKTALSGTEYDLEHDYDGQFRKTDTYYSLDSVRIRKHSHYDYDAEHHLIRTTTYPESGKEICIDTMPYPNGLPHTITDGRGVVTSMTYDTCGNPETTQTGSEPAVCCSYDQIGRMTRLADQENAVSTFSFDRRGLMTLHTDPLMKNRSCTWYDNGDLCTKTDRNNNTIAFTYTPGGKLDTITYPDASAVSFSYDILGNLTGMSDHIWTTHYGYDNANRLTSITDPRGFAIGIDYDEAGNITGITYPGGRKVEYTHDALNRLTAVHICWLNKTACYTYNEAGLLSGLDHFNGTWTSYGYDNAGRMTDLQNRKGDLSAVSTYHYTLDGSGNRTHIEHTEPQTPSLQANSEQYTYNEKKTRLLSAGTTPFGYDDEGQMISKGGTAYNFDYEHRLTDTDGGAFRYSYDGTGRRLEAIRSTEATRYIYDASGNLLAEADGNNTITRYYIHGLGLLAMATPAGELYCYHFNATGSTIAVTDDNQNTVNRYSYTPFGEIIEEQETIPQPFKYIGRHGVMHEPNGLYYMRARYYDPATGRFISEDPIGFEGGDVNLYAYTGNNPVNLTDPFGLWTLSLGITTSGGLGIGGGGGTFVNVGHDPSKGFLGGWPASLTGTAQAGM
ncbi:MAG: hypothetical protein M0P57_03120 [Syntrophales bacterium]|jgi:RHS repeat-associated protein|nr:hypothetical protein [Syntrophales bacterium]MDY0045335.1 RHS repeat-associated core domain-containing protein [Syntrophales bacterium]